MYFSTCISEKFVDISRYSKKILFCQIHNLINNTFTCTCTPLVTIPHIQTYPLVSSNHATNLLFKLSRRLRSLERFLRYFLTQNWIFRAKDMRRIDHYSLHCSWSMARLNVISFRRVHEEKQSSSIFKRS